MKRLADQIASWFIAQGLPEEQKEIYSYGLECLANELLADILLFLSALLLHKIPEMFIWCFSFTTPLYNFIHDNQMTEARISEPLQEHLILL